MISRGAVIWIMAAIFLGGAMIVIKARVQGLEEELASIQTEIRAEERATHVLKAEWSYRNKPEVLREMAARHLSELGEMNTEQIVRIEDLPFRPVPEAGPELAPTVEKQR